MEKISILKILFGKDDQAEIDAGAGGKKFSSRELSGSMTKRNKKPLSKSLFKIVKYMSGFLSHLSSRSYGTVLFSFGIISTLMYFLKLSFATDIVTPIVGAAVCVFSLPFLIFDKPLAVVLQDFVVTDYIFYEFFCMKRHNDLEGEKKLPFLAAVFLGAIPAALSAFFPLWQITVAIGIIVVIYVGMESPESIFLISLFAIPYLVYLEYAELCLMLAVGLAFVSFIRKVIFGKRVLCIEQYDVFIGLMMLFILISGVFFKGSESFADSIAMIVLSLGYTLAGNIITNRRLAERVINSIVISGTFASVISIIQLGYIFLTKEDEITLSNLSLLLARTDGMAMFLIVSTLFSFGMIMQYHNQYRAIYVIPAILCLIALVISGEFFAILILVVGLLAYYIIKANKLTLVLLPVLLCLPVLALLLPNSLLDLVFYYSPSIASAEKLFELWNNSLTVLINNFFMGVGMGSESFAQEMANLGMFGYPDSSNLFIEIGLEAGVFALLFFLCVLVTRIRHRSIQHLYVRNSQIRTLVGISGTCIFCLLSFGMINYIWSNTSAYYLFWCVFGIGSGLLRFAKKDYDDRVLYYEEASAHDSSVIDIEIG